MLLLVMRPCSPSCHLRVLGLLLALSTSAACKTDPGPPDPSSATPTAQPEVAEPTRPVGMHVEILMAGRPPHRSLALVDVTPGEDAHPISISATGYGEDGEVRRKIRGTLRNTTVVTGGLHYTLQVEAPEGTQASPSKVAADRWGPTEAFENFSDDLAVEAVLRSLLVPVPKDAVGEGAIYRVDVPFGGGEQTTGIVVRTTADVVETFADGYLLKTDTVLHDRGQAQPEPIAEVKGAPPPAGFSGRTEFIVTSRQWRHYDRLLPAKAYGQFRYTDRSRDPARTLIVDWSLDDAAPPPETP